MKKVHTSNAPEAIGPYSQAIRVGDLLFTSGQTPLTIEGKLVEGSITDQTKRVLANLKAVLEAEGYSIHEVVKANVYLQSMNYFAEMNEVYGQFFGDHKPARTTVEVAGLPKGADVEIDFIAAKSKE
jgi:2-iminobutanoate/2-iminopropanoate deaminase